MRVLLFSGHMVDRPDRLTPRFPARFVPSARSALARELDSLSVQAADRAVTGGASGGDLLFAEQCLARGLRLDLFLPFRRERFVETSVLPGGREWLGLFDSVVEHPRTALHVGSPASGSEEDAYVHCNLAMLERAIELAHGPIDLVCMWDGETGDGPGGTEHMVKVVRTRGGRVHWIDTRALGDAGEQAHGDQQ
jgi:hypothetical protein